jgi:very-short-patch-repair endonuclease
MRYDLQKAKKIFIDRGYIPLFNKYINTKTKYLAKTKEGYKFEMNIDNIKYGKNSNCFSNKNPYLIENIEKLINYKNLNLKVIDKKFENSKLYILIKCEKHNYEFYIRKGDLNKGKGCKYCGHEITSFKQTNTIEDIRKKLKIKNKNLEILSDTYINNLEKLNIYCKKCDYIWEASWGNLQKYKICPKCNGSIGEKKIINFLNNNNIEYKYQYKFNECKNIKLLPFDFYLKKYNLLIEYDGEYHYLPARYSKNKNKMLEKLEKIKNNDNIKNAFCKKYNIKLLRIPYFKLNQIEEILKKELQI